MKKLATFVLVLTVVLCTSEFAAARGGNGGGQLGMGGRNSMSPMGQGNAYANNMQRMMMMQNRYRLMQRAQYGQGQMLPQQFRYGYGQPGFAGGAAGFQSANTPGLQATQRMGVGMGNGAMQRQRTQNRVRQGR